MIDIGENMPLIGGKASRAGEFNDLDKLYEKEIVRIDKLDGKNDLGDNTKEIAALKANAKVGYEARQDALHAKHEQQVDEKYGKGMYAAQQQAEKAGKEVTPKQKEAIWKADATCKYNQIDQKQQAHVKQVGKAGQYASEKASAAKKAVGSFAERVYKGSAPAAGVQR